MKLHLSILLSVVLIMSAVRTQASQLRLISVKQPIYLLGSDTDVQIVFLDVIVATYSSDPEAPYAAIAAKNLPSTVGPYENPPDINLASQYGITVEANANDAREFIVTIDASQAKVPEGCPFTIGQVIDAVTTCVKIMTPIEMETARKFTLKIIPPPEEKPADQAAPDEPKPKP